MSPEWQQAVDQFLAEIRARSDSIASEYSYRIHLRRFFADRDPREVNSIEVHGYIYAPTPKGRPPLPATVCARLVPIRGFYRRALRWGLVARDPTDGIKPPPIPEGKPRARPVGEIARLVNAVWPAIEGQRLAEPRAARDRAMIMCAYLTLMRRAEVLRLTADSLRGEWKRGSETAFAVLRVKGGRTRKFHVPPPVVDAIFDLLDVREIGLRDLEPREPIWGPCSISSFRAAIIRAARHAGLGLITPHDLRRSGALRRLQLTRDLQQIQHQLGHAKLSTSESYLRREVEVCDPHWRALWDDLNSA